ncbi:MAG: DNA polymerase III subunit delta [Flavobacteriaceae bacterium]|nr:DNA polymerase III subunit delta [Flavobacteriaceae bacterium]RCL69351.1 MAG: DNA polymerase III subunit delta [Bacteroidota bacterium]
MTTLSEIKNDIKTKTFSPIYLLMGEEEFYIDNITNLFIQNVLTEEEKQFNLNILYGKDTSIDQIISICKKYPLMSDFQIVLVKEAQDLSRTFDSIIEYVKNPLKTTILIINYKHKSIDKRKVVYKEINKVGKIFESKKLYDNQVQNWINEKINIAGFSIDQKSTVLINEHLGNSLSKISNEIDKLLEIKKNDKIIKSDDVEKYIGISKEFNNFELRRALGEKNFDKAFQITQYFSENPNSNPLVVSISIIFDFFNKLLIYHSNSNSNDKKMAALLGINPFFLSEYHIASRNYSLKSVVGVISVIRDYDMYSKGVKVKKANPYLLKELITRIINSN